MSIPIGTLKKTVFFYTNFNQHTFNIEPIIYEHLKFKKTNYKMWIAIQQRGL